MILKGMTLVCKSYGIDNKLINPIYGCINHISVETEMYCPND